MTPPNHDHSRRLLRAVRETLRQVLELRREANAMAWRLYRMSDTVQHSLSDVEAQVALLTTEVGSAEALIQSLADKLKATGFDPAQVERIYQDLVANKDRLAAAVVANTPSAPAPPATP